MLKTGPCKIPPHSKNSKLDSGNSSIHVFNTHTYCLTIENAYLTTSVNNHFYSICIGLNIDNNINK